MSSTHMNITSGLRRTSRPTAPAVNRTAARTRYQVVVGSGTGRDLPVLGLLELGQLAGRAAREQDGGHHGDDEEDRGDLEGEQVVGEERLGQPLNVRRVTLEQRAHRRR